MFPGGLGKDRLAEWGRRCQAERQTAQLIVGHVGNKGTPPPRAWFLPPACLSHCVRLALIRFRVKVFQSLEDHHLEVVAFFRENGFHGLLAHDSEYALYNIPSYYSSHALKLSWNGKNLTTNQFLIQEVAKQLGLKRMNFPIFAALLGNHILPDEDLAAFHWSLLGPEHPLASLKVRAHQLVLPPCDVVIKAVSEYVSSIKDPSNLDVVGKDVFKQSQVIFLFFLNFCFPVPSVILKEWSAYKGKSPQTPELVSALTFREWTCPNLKKLWLGKAVEDKNRRMRAFLACMKSDTPSMLNPANVPAHLLLMCCVLRYMVQWPGGRILHRHELDTFLAQAVSTQLYEPDQLQELKIEKLDARGIQLAALFMSGVDTALFANDACGQPVPWEHCCPWIYFDGKLFQSKLIKAGQERVSLVELCDGQADLASKVEKMRQSILEGVNMNHPPPSALLPSPTFVPPMVPPLYPVSLYSRAMGSMPPPPQGRSRGFAGLHPIPPQGGKLEIAGMVVGQWAGSRSSRGRGSFGMQVVSVGGPGKGHGKEQTGRGSKGHKKGNKQSTSDGISKSLEPHQGRSYSQINGNNGTLIKEEKSDHHLPAPSQCALSRDSNVCTNGNRYFPMKEGEKNCLREQKLGTVTQQKEE
uniref:Family with sequence similarity 120C n=1 Tax=Suricata suricatta TaxID=37032 RepID=A0A673V8P7_SURSU